MKIRKRLGEILKEDGLLTEKQLKQALGEHQRNGLKLGEYLITQGIVRENDLMNAVSRQLRIPRYLPSNYPVDAGLSSLLPAETAQQHRTIPLERRGNLLTVAMVDPMDIDALDSVEIATNREVEPVICSEQEFNQLFGTVYGVYQGLGEVVSGMDDLGYDEEPPAFTDDIQLTSLQGMAEEVPVVRLVNSILSQAIRDKASDVHISPEKKYVQVRFRIDGKLQDVPAPPKQMFLPIVSRLKILANMDIATSRVPQDGRFTVNIDGKEINIRASSLPTIYGENIVLRLLDMSSAGYNLDQLGILQHDIDKISSIMHKPYGMILTSGPTGSGKTTTLYGVLKEINTPDINIVTLEDPVEFRIEKIRQVQLNRRAGMTFASGLRSILRQDPDVVMLGEIRDHETASTAVQAAMTGHRLLSTLHTNDAAGAITRFIDMGIEPFLISSVLLASIAQRLVRRVCSHCAESYRPEDKLLRFWGLDRVENADFKRGTGCPTCNGTGFKGRVGVYEVLVNDEQIQSMIIQRSSSQEITRAARAKSNLRTLKEDAARKVLMGLTTLEEATSAVMV